MSDKAPKEQKRWNVIWTNFDIPTVVLSKSENEGMTAERVRKEIRRHAKRRRKYWKHISKRMKEWEPDESCPVFIP